MTNVLTSKLRTADSLTKNGKYRKAIDILDNIDIQDVNDVAGDYYLLLAECHISLGNLKHDYPDKAILYFKRTVEHDKYGLAKFLKGQQLQLQGNKSEAISALNEAYASSIRSDNLELSSRILNWLSYVLYKAGSIDGAIDNLNKCISLELSLNNHHKIKRFRNNIARICISTGRFNYAIETLEKSLNKLDEKDDTYLNAILSLSLSYALQGERQKALNLITSKGSEFSESQHQQFIYHEYYGQILMLDSQLAESFLQLHKGLDLALKTAPESDMISQIERLLGDAYLISGDYKKAKSHTTKALKVAERINEKVEIAACYRILAQLEYKKENNDKAKELFKKSIDIFRLINSNYELAVTRYLAASTSLYSADEKLGMLYQAKEYFESENITHYIDNVQLELRKLKNAVSTKISKTSKRSSTDAPFVCPNIITANKKMLDLLDFTKRVAVDNANVLLRGDTGTGKELFAQYIHYHSGRTGKLITVNTAAIPETMIESELFGHEKGAFTGAAHTKPGKFELADKGTIFLDEIGDMPLLLQAKLLRVLEEKKVERLGAVKKIDLDVRVIAATNKDLEKMSEENLFRFDLFYRLNVIKLQVPSLADRQEDFYPLVAYFLKEFAINTDGIDSEVRKLAELLSTKEYIGNVRELQSEVRCLLLASKNSIPIMIDLITPLKAKNEKQELLSLLNEYNWNKSKVARLLDISEGTVRNRIVKFDILQPTQA